MPNYGSTISRLVKIPYLISITNNSWDEFLFDGYWLVFNEDSRFKAHAIDGFRVVEGPICPFGGCVLHLSDGMVAYGMYGEDDLFQFQTHVFDLETEQEIQIGEMRPYFDRSGPEYFLGGRLLWTEHRGEGIGDDCGNYHSADADYMLFWKDIEF